MFESVVGHLRSSRCAHWPPAVFDETAWLLTHNGLLGVAMKRKSSRGIATTTHTLVISRLSHVKIQSPLVNDMPRILPFRWYVQIMRVTHLISTFDDLKRGVVQLELRLL